MGIALGIGAGIGVGDCSGSGLKGWLDRWDATSASVSVSKREAYLAKTMVEGDAAQWLLGDADDDATPEQRAFYAFLAESSQRYIREHKNP